MDVHDAYGILGLVPVDEFLRRRLREAPTDVRGIGATTWMLVAAAVRAIGGGDAIVVGHNLSYAERMAFDCLGHAARIDPVGGARRKMGRIGRTVILVSGGRVRWESDRTLERSMRGYLREYETFSDGRWKMRALERQKGPFACIRLIERVGTAFLAYDDRGEFLLELTAAGANDVAIREGMRVEKVGW